MSADEIRHLDSGTSPFDVIVAVDAAITTFRLALAQQIANTLTYDAVRDQAESSLMLAGQLLWDCRDALVACVESDDA